jgi:hypothetical protein
LTSAVPAAWAFANSGKRLRGLRDAKCRKIAALEGKLQRKHEILAEFMEEHVQQRVFLHESGRASGRPPC